MWCTCKYAVTMAMIQLRHVPDELHRRLKARAAMAGMSLSDYTLEELRRGLERPTRHELLDALEHRRRRTYEESPTELVRTDRDRE